jgi:hypothetical protein
MNLSGLWLANIGALITATLGLTAILRPQLIEKMVSIKPTGVEGVSEIRATYGGFFAGMATYAMIMQSMQAFVLLGVGWLSAAAVRLVTLPFGSTSAKNFGGVVFETLIGVLCVSGWFFAQ